MPSPRTWDEFRTGAELFKTRRAGLEYSLYRWQRCERCGEEYEDDEKWRHLGQCNLSFRVRSMYGIVPQDIAGA